MIRPEDQGGAGPPFEVGSSIPVVRMLDEDASRAFYLDYLGYRVDWEHRFSDESPLYMQIRLGESVIHLNGHAGDDAPKTEVRIPVVGFPQFCEHLAEKARQLGHEKPVPVDPRHEGVYTDLNLLDPADNHLVFWLREP